jgi:hypothetical protein
MTNVAAKMPTGHSTQALRPAKNQRVARSIASMIRPSLACEDAARIRREGARNVKGG